MTLLFAGDPHRNFSPILRACLAHPVACPPGHLILLGDQDCPRPLTAILAVSPMPEASTVPGRLMAMLDRLNFTILTSVE